MQDYQLLQDLCALALPHIGELADRLEQAGITSYSQLFTLLRDESTEPERRIDACWAIQVVNRCVDSRRAIFPLMKAMQSANENVRAAAISALGRIKNRRAVPAMLAILEDRSQSEWVRINAIDALSSEKQAAPLFRRLMFDKTEGVNLRTHAVEWGAHLLGENAIPDYITLLSDSAPDIRFWAAFGLSQMFTDISAAREKLDAMVAFDDSLPQYWGWHINREAIRPLQKIYYAPYEVCSLEYG